MQVTKKATGTKANNSHTRHRKFVKSFISSTKCTNWMYIKRDALIGVARNKKKTHNNPERIRT